MDCIYNTEDFCTHDQCPARGDFCPVPDTEGICQYEEREDIAYKLTPKGCLLLAVLHSGIYIDDYIFDNIWDEFAANMEKCGYCHE